MLKKTLISYRLSIFFITLITIIATYIYLYFIPYTYESKAIIKVKINPKPKISNQLTDNTIGIKQEILTLQTFKINSKVLQEIDFSIQYFQKKDFLQNSLESETLVPNKARLKPSVPSFARCLKNHKMVEEYETSPINITLIHEIPKISYHKIILIKKDSGFTLSSQELGESKKYPFNQKIKTPYFSGIVTKKSPITQPIQLLFNGSPRHIYESIIKKRLKVSQIAPDANLIEITFQDTIPKRANKYIDTLIKIYIEESLKEKGDGTQKILFFLDEQLNTIKKKLENSEKKLEHYKENNHVEPNIQLQDSFSKLSSIDLELSELSLKEKLAKNLLTFVLNNRNLDAIAPTLLEFNSQATTHLIDMLSELQNQEEELKVEYTDNYPKLIIINKNIKRIKNKILLNIKNIKSTLTAKRINLEKQKNRYEKLLKELPQKENRLISLKRDYEVNSKMYTYLLKKKSENELIKVAISSDYEVIEQAYNSNIPIKPKRLLLTLSAVVGLLLALFISWIRALFIDNVTTKRDIELMSKFPIYGVIPFYKNAIFATTQLKEAYHKLATNIHLFKPKKNGNIVLITSKTKGEGKTTTVVSLAGAFNNANFKTIIVDLNLKNPSLHTHFRIESQYAGLSTYLSQRDNIGNIIYTTDYKNLDIIPAGLVAPSPYELILSNRLFELFDFLKVRYDYIIIDTASYDNATETLAIMKLTTMNLIMIQEGVSKKSTLIELEKISQERNISNIGLVLKSIVKDDKQRGEDILNNNITSLTQNTHPSQISR